MSMDQILSKAIEIGELLREESVVKRLMASNMALEAKADLKENITKFETLRQKLIKMEQDGASQEEMEAQNVLVMDAYELVMADPVMVEVAEARSGVDDVLNHIVRTIGSCITGEFDDSDGCSDCSSCSGCS